jgi:hypothetical protein
MRALKRISWLLALLCAGAIPATSACSDINDPSCVAEGKECGFFVGSCCAGLHCSEAVCRNGAAPSHRFSMVR